MFLMRLGFRFVYAFIIEIYSKKKKSNTYINNFLLCYV